MHWVSMGPDHMHYEHINCTCVHGIHDVKTYAGQGFNPAFLVTIDQETNRLGHSFVGIFTHTVGLRVEGT